jgi:hypothetical protein
LKGKGYKITGKGTGTEVRKEETKANKVKKGRNE